MDDLKYIKKYYGEDMMHYVRDNFSTILEESGKISEIFEKSFYPNKGLYNDLLTEKMLQEFNRFIMTLYEETKTELYETDKDPFELMDLAGYTLYKCETKEDIMKFKKYFTKGEELCTFRQERLETCHVFFAVKKNVDEIKRIDFDEPRREDEYGTSVISIQFTRGENNYLSIKNRYNHTVVNPDATFYNNLDNIIRGLTRSFEKKYGYNIHASGGFFELDIPYYLSIDDKYYKFNIEKNNIYYCSDNIIIDNYLLYNRYTGDNQARYIIMDCYILDLKEKRLYSYSKINDYMFNYYRGIKHIDIRKKKNEKRIYIELNNGDRSCFILDKNNRVIGYINNDIKEVESDFLNCEHLNYVEMNSLKKTGDRFIRHTNGLKKISFPKLNNVGNDFMKDCFDIEEAYLPNLKYAGDLFLGGCRNLNKLYCPNLVEVKNGFLANNKELDDLYFPNLTSVGFEFLWQNRDASRIYAPKLIQVGNNFMFKNQKVRIVNFPNLKYIGNSFMSWNTNATKVSLKSAIEVGDSFMKDASRLKKLYMPNVRIIKNNFVRSSYSLRGAYFPNLEEIGSSFMECNDTISYVYMPKVRKIGSYFFGDNNSLVEISLPCVEEVGNNFLYINEVLKKMYMPNLKIVEKRFMKNCNVVDIDLPNVTFVDDYFMDSNESAKTIRMGKVDSIADNFLGFNETLEYAYFNNLKTVGNGFLTYSKNLKEFYAPKLRKHGNYFLKRCNNKIIVSSELLLKDRLKNGLKLINPINKIKILKK